MDQPLRPPLPPSGRPDPPPAGSGSPPAGSGSPPAGPGSPPAGPPPFVHRARPEDFEVEERPAAPPEGEGEHLWLWIEKRGLSTPAAEERLAGALGVDRRRIGRAGLKDAVAVTRQALTVHDPRGELSPAEALALDLGPGLWVLEAGRARAGLRPGRLDGNRFRLRLRAVTVAPEVLARRLAELERRGVPARFGPQRYGARGDGDRIGVALLAGDLEQVVALACGRPGPHDHGPVREARERFEAGDPRGAAALFPATYGPSARLARAFASNRGRAANALRALPLGDLQLWIDAAQSRVFDRVVALRGPDLGRLLDGDVLRPTAGERDRAVERAAPWQAAADAFECSPTGPLPGRRVPFAQGSAGAVERRALEELDLAPTLFDAGARWRVHGSRRPLRLRLAEPVVASGADEHGPFVELGFDLPPGGYATVVLEELSRP